MEQQPYEPEQFHSGEASETAVEASELRVPELLGRLDRLYISDDTSPDAIQLRRELREAGGQASGAIMGRLEGDQRPENSDEWYAALVYCAVPEDSPRLLEHLKKHEELDLQICETLGRVGGPAEAEALKAQTEEIFLNRTRRTTDSGFEIRLNALIAIEMRHEDMGQTLSRGLLDRYNSELADGWLFSEIDDESYERKRSLFLPAFQALAFEKRFEQLVIDDDYFDDVLSEEIELDITKTGVSANSRINTIRRLREVVDSEVGDFTAGSDIWERRLRRLETMEANWSQYAPTLGIEIEIFRRTLDIDSEQTERKVSDTFYKTVESGLPRGADAYWEFANAPANSSRTLSREVQALIDLGLVNTEWKRHPLHLTIGGVTSKGLHGPEAYLLARALEATGWCSTAGRIRKPTLTDKLAWTAKGVGGIVERRSEALQGANTSGVEIRTFQFQSLGGLDRLLYSASLLGSALRAYQMGAQDQEGQELGKVWQAFSGQIQEVFERFGLKNPAEYWFGAGGDLDKAFLQMADLMEEAETDANSRGGQFVAEVQQAIIDARHGVSAHIKDPEVAYD